MVMYAQESDLAVLNSAELSERLAAVLRDAMPWLVTISEAEASVPESASKWSAKQVMGHLTDSAVNNLARFIAGGNKKGRAMTPSASCDVVLPNCLGDGRLAHANMPFNQKHHPHVPPTSEPCGDFFSQPSTCILITSGALCRSV